MKIKITYTSYPTMDSEVQEDVVMDVANFIGDALLKDWQNKEFDYDTLWDQVVALCHQSEYFHGRISLGVLVDNVSVINVDTVNDF